MRVLSLQREWDRALEEALAALRAGELVIYPTDTAYGLGGDATREDVVERLYRAKGRPSGKPVSVLVASLPMLEEWFDVDEHKEVLQRYLPGPYTFIVRARKPLAVGERVGVRIPHYWFARARRFGKPITATSANISGNPAPHSVEELDEIGERVALVVDGGPSPIGGVSTVVDLIERRVVRRGVGEFSFEEP